MTRLGVNIDHVATLRQARGGHEPEPILAALLAQDAGAHGITAHLRGDRRHIQERDLRLLKDVLTVPLNVECAATPDALGAVIPVKPHWVTLVPETRDEVTTQGGLDAVFLQAVIKQAVRDLHASGIRVSLFVDPVAEQIKMASRLEADAIELHTGVYATLSADGDAAPEIQKHREAASLGARLGLKVLAGHGLTLQNVEPIAAIPAVEELNIGHSLMARAIMVGMDTAVRDMLKAIGEAHKEGR